MTTILDGKKVRDERRDALAERVAELETLPRLVIIRVGEREDTKAYVAQKQKMGDAIGVEVDVRVFDDDISEDELLLTIGELNNTPGVHGLIVQLPLPEHIDVFRVIEAVDPAKDVDGLTAINMKKLMVGAENGFVPATAKGVLTLLDNYDIDIEGMRAVVVGRSMLVGKPVALSLLNRNATITVAHSKTQDLASVTKSADILVTAVGEPGMITQDHVTASQVVVDVGINLNTGASFEEEIPRKKFVGDVSPDAVKDVVSAITPVPGGVGPMTVVSLFENVVEAAVAKGVE